MSVLKTMCCTVEPPLIPLLLDHRESGSAELCCSGYDMPFEHVISNWYLVGEYYCLLTIQYV